LVYCTMLLRCIIFLAVAGICTAGVQPKVTWVFTVNDLAHGQAAAADIDGDGKLEIVFGCYRNDSTVYALNAENGSLLWKYNTSLPTREGCNDVAPIIYDVDGDGKPDVIVPASCTDSTYCFNGADGSIKWTVKTRGSDSPPTIADIDGDGIPEILHGEFGGFVICINALDGTVKWEIAVDTRSWIQTAPTIVDINNDGDLDFVVATWNAVDTLNNKVYAYRGKDQKLLWAFPVTDVIYHGSAIADLDGDGRSELVIGSYNDTLYCLNADDGALKWKYSLGKYYYVGGPAQIADLDNDGNCDVFFISRNTFTALKGNGEILWQKTLKDYDDCFRGAAIADITNDEYPDIVFGTSKGRLIALSGNNGSEIFTFDLRKEFNDTLFRIDHAPLIADFDRDGLLDAFIVGGYSVMPDFSGNYGKACLVNLGRGKGPDWLMFQNNILRNSAICPLPTSTVMEAVSPEIEVSVTPNPVTVGSVLQITSPTETVFTWRVVTIQGRTVSGPHTAYLETGPNTIPLSSFPGLVSGTYYIVFSSGSQQRTIQITVP